jgi:hypothetical protein
VVFRVTVGLGQDSVDAAVLEGRATALQGGLDAVDEGAVVVVDLVKAALQLVLSMHADDAVDAAQQALRAASGALRDAGLDAPASMVTVDAEAVPAPTQDHLLRPHPAHAAPAQD